VALRTRSYARLLADATGGLLYRKSGTGSCGPVGAGRTGAQWVHGAAGLVAGPVKWTERWIARAQRKADLRDARFRRHEDGVRAGTEPPSLMDRMESWNALCKERSRTRIMVSWAQANERRISRHWPLAAQSYGASLADAWRTWVTDGPVRGPDGVEVTIWVRYADQDLPFHDPPDDQAWPTWQELAGSRAVYTVCVRRMPPGHVLSFCSFATETSARWYAVELARTVRQAGITGMRPSDIFPERPRPGRREGILAAEIIGVRSGSGHGLLQLPQRARARWRQARTGRR